jgi:membrane protease YdiL (CAAX protease family)
MTDASSQHGRLQRRPASGGQQITTFRQVLRRHGGAMAAIALACFFLTNSNLLLQSGFAKLSNSPFFYLVALPGLFSLFIGYLLLRHRTIDSRTIIWILYLLLISILEEIAFRLLLPLAILSSTGLIVSIIISNSVFATIHFFTLRWKLVNCIGAFLGGLGLSRLFYVTEDLALIILVHWFFTFLNTPSPPRDLTTQE